MSVTWHITVGSCDRITLPAFRQPEPGITGGRATRRRASRKHSYVFVDIEMAVSAV